MKILLLGRNGQLGWELARCLAPLGDVTAVDYPDIDLADLDKTRQWVRQNGPQIIVNATAYTAVDKAESTPELAYAINGRGPGLLAEEARKLGAALIHYSTDYVFDGGQSQPYVETDTPNPLNVYGKSKLAGEQAVQAHGGSYLILRTAWVYSMRRDSFVTKVLQWTRQQEVLRVVDDQISNPTWARLLAEATAQLLARGRGMIDENAGLYHLAGSGHASRFEWAHQIMRLDPNRDQQIVKEIQPVPTGAFPTPARRPLFSALDCSRFEKTFGLSLPDWRVGLALAMAECP